MPCHGAQRGRFHLTLPRRRRTCWTTLYYRTFRIIILHESSVTRDVTKPEVTVLTPTYNRARYVAQAIASLQAQTEENWKAIVIDDGSQDDTHHIIGTFAASDRRIRVLALTENRGLAAALAAGLAAVQTPYFVILDSDDWFAPNTLAVLLNEFHQQPSTVSLVCGNAVVWVENADGSLIEKERIPGQAFSNQYDFVMYGPTLVPRFLRTETVRRVGGFEIDALTGGRMLEDKLLLLKLIHISTFAYVDADVYHIRVHADNMTKPETREKFHEVKRYIYTRMLKEWGDAYEAEFCLHEEGWLDVKALHKKTPTHSLAP